MTNPKFSIIIPCFNQSHFLGDCVNSLLDQAFERWEILLINDGSTDETGKLGEVYGVGDKRIKLINQSNQGLSAARNSGLKAAIGDYLLFLDADDWLEPSCLQRYSDMLGKRADPLQLIRCGYSYWDQPQGRCYHSHLPYGQGSIWPAVLTDNIGPCHSILVSRELASLLGGFDTELRSCEDWDFWIRAGKMGACIFSIPEVLVAYRYVSDSMSRNPEVMYRALTEVSRRAAEVDSRLPEGAKYNKSYSLDYPEIQKRHLITMLGVMLHQGKVEDSIEWYASEQKLWKWDIKEKDWNRLSSYLSWGYFFEKEEIEKLIQSVIPLLKTFFRGVGYHSSQVESLSRRIMLPQLKKRNHLRYGRNLGALKNKLGWY